MIGRPDALALEALDLRTHKSRANYSRLPALNPQVRLDTGGTSAAFIGSHAGQSEFFDGDVDDVRIYDQGLGTQAIRQLSNANADVNHDHLVGWWPFNGDFRNAVSAVAAGSKTASFVDGRLGQALRLNGTDQTVVIQHYAALKPSSGQITIAAWVRTSSTPDEWMEIYRKDDGEARQLLALGRTGYYGLWLGLGIDGQYVEVGGQLDRQSVGDGQWHHVAGTFDGQTVRLYFDGQPIGSQAFGLIDEPSAAVDPADDRLRVAFVGNTLIQRAAEYGFLETELTRLSLGRDVVFRNLGWPGDTVAGEARAEFGPQERNRSNCAALAAISATTDFEKC